MDRLRDAGHEMTSDSNDYTTADDNLVTAEPFTDQAIIDTVRGPKPGEAEIESDNNDNILVSEVPTHTKALTMCNRLLAYLETRSHSDYYVNSLHKFINNEQYNARQQTQVTDFFHVIDLLYVMSQTYYFVHCMLCLITNQKIK